VIGRDEDDVFPFSRAITTLIGDLTKNRKKAKQKEVNKFHGRFLRGRTRNSRKQIKLIFLSQPLRPSHFAVLQK
jgi:hypothetical protein